MNRYSSSSGSREERQPLLQAGGTDSRDETAAGRDSTSAVTVQRHITLVTAVGIMVGSSAGIGIFISPSGVTQQVGSVGISLIVWALTGVFSLLLALCYAELGTALPVSGGDYAYIDYVFGPLPAFLCLWVMVVLIGPCGTALAARTISAYFLPMIGLECNTLLSIIISLWIVASSAALNAGSVKWSARCVTVFSAGKVLAMCVIIVTGLVRLGLGFTSEFSEPFANSVTDPGSIMVSFLPAFVTYAGWDCVNALAEEMKNPKRDLPLATGISLVLVTSVYTLINVAYFTALSPAEFIESDAVASLFASRAVPPVKALVPVFVIVSSFGSSLNLFLACPRWAFAGGRNGALPEILSFVHVKCLTPMPSIVLMCLLTMFFSAAVFFDIQDILNITSIIVQVKMIMTLMALLVLKYKEPNKNSTISVHFTLVILSLLILVVVTVIPLWQTPRVGLTAAAIFVAGLPLYYLRIGVGRLDGPRRAMKTFIINTQKACLLAPTTREDKST